MLLALLFILGIVIGGLVTAFIFIQVSVGTLRIDRSDPNDVPYLFLELSTSPNEVGKKKYVMLKVSTENYLSQN